MQQALQIRRADRLHCGGVVQGADLREFDGQPNGRPRSRPFHLAGGQQRHLAVADLELDLRGAPEVQLQRAEGGHENVSATRQRVQRLTRAVVRRAAPHPPAERASRRERAGNRVTALGDPVSGRLGRPDPDGLDMERQRKILGQALSAARAAGSGRHPAPAHCRRSAGQLLGRVVGEREPLRAAQLQICLDPFRESRGGVIGVGEIVAGYATAVLADIADDGGEHVVDRAVAADQLVESGDRVGGNAEPGNVDRCAR